MICCGCDIVRLAQVLLYFFLGSLSMLCFVQVSVTLVHTVVKYQIVTTLNGKLYSGRISSKMTC